MSNFDTRTKEEKNTDEILLKIKRGLDMLTRSYIPIESFTQLKEGKVSVTFSTEGSHLFTDQDLGWIHCVGFDEHGERFRKYSKNTRYVECIHYKIK